MINLESVKFYRKINKVQALVYYDLVYYWRFHTFITGYYIHNQKKPYMASLESTIAYWQIAKESGSYGKDNFKWEEWSMVLLRKYHLVRYHLDFQVKLHNTRVPKETPSVKERNAKQHMTNYIDDIYISTETPGNLARCLIEIFDQIQISQPWIGIKKFSVGRNSVKYLGFIAIKNS